MNTSAIRKFFPVALSGCMLSSCVYDSNPVPEMPYTPRRQAAAPVALQPAAPQPMTAPGTWVSTTTAPALTPAPQLPMGYMPVTQPAVRPAVPQPVAPAVRPAVQTTAPATSSHITQTFTPPALTPQPAAMQPPAVSTVTPPTPSAAGQASTPTDPKLITNTGPIPVAMRVEGDPIRVYNPLDTTKTIRIIDPKTGKVHPSGKVLKVKGTNFKFIVP